jgi:hypothetical protein
MVFVGGMSLDSNVLDSRGKHGDSTDMEEANVPTRTVGQRVDPARGLAVL